MPDPRTNTELNKIIGEWLGWRSGHWSTWASTTGEGAISGSMWDPSGFLSPQGVAHDKMPNWCEDLNALAQAKQKLNDEEFRFYLSMLMRQVLEEKHAPDNYPRAWHSRTARQQAEALVEAIKPIQPSGKSELPICTKCGGEMIMNVPRMGPDGGYVHRKTGQILCPDHTWEQVKTSTT